MSQSRPQTAQKPKDEDQPNNAARVIVLIILIIGIGVGSYFLYPIVKAKFFTKPVEVVEELPTVTEVIEEQPPVTEVLEPFRQESSSSVPKGFYIIVGSYRIKSNADHLVTKLKKDIELKVLFFEELGLYRVSAGQYDNIHKAYNDLYSIKDLDGCTNAWVLENK